MGRNEEENKRIAEMDCYLGLGLDWARISDETIASLATPENDVVGWFKYPHVNHQEQIELLLKDLEPYKDRISSVRSDATGADMITEYLELNSWLPMDKNSAFKFSLQSKANLYSEFEESLHREDELGFSYPADHPLAEQFEEQMTGLIREYKGTNGEYLSVHHPDEAGAKDDIPDSTALALSASKNSTYGDIIF